MLASLAAGVALASGCTDRTLTDTENAGGSSGGDESTTSDEPGTSATTNPGTTPTPIPTTDDGSEGDPPKYDVAPATSGTVPEPPPVPPETCTHGDATAYPCDAGEQPEVALYYRCMPPPPEGECAVIDPYDVLLDANACLGAGECGGPAFVDVACGPDPTVLDACCYNLVYDAQLDCPPEGRPFIVDGRARLAPADSHDAWGASLRPDVRALDARERAALAEAWTACARSEHASIASFARFVLQLLAAGAPAELVASAQQAMREEVEHARVCFGLASAYAGAPIGPGALRVDGALRDADDLAAVAAATASEGCIAETISALHIAIAATHARDPIVAQLLRRIADEELRHAELAWTFVAWALHHGPPAVRTAVANVFATPHRSIPRAAALDDSLPAALYLAHGLLPANHRDPLTQRALTEIILPAARHLLAHPSTNAEKRGENVDIALIL